MKNPTGRWSSKALKISDLKLKYHTKCWNLGFCPSGPPGRRNGGECFAPWNNNLLCAAARRKCENCARGARRSLEIMKILNLGTFGNQHFRISTSDYLVICILCHCRFLHWNLTKIDEIPYRKNTIEKLWRFLTWNWNITRNVET